PSSMALPSRPGRKPQPSSTIRTTGVRCPRGFAILEAMQSSQVLRALPVVLLYFGHPLCAQQQYRVSGQKAWLYQEPEGKRLAQLVAGAGLTGSDSVRDAWRLVTLDGWIFAGSVGSAARD